MITLIVVLVVVGIILVLVASLWLTYNGLVRQRMRVNEAWAGIDVQLKRRSSLVPNLVETVRGYAEHERGVFEEVARARAALTSAPDARAAADANNQLTVALRSLFAVAEAYPQLVASQNFRELQQELSDLEAKIAYARQFYNTNVMDYNTRIKVFPTVLLASAMGFGPAEFFAATEEERADVHVSFERKQ